MVFYGIFGPGQLICEYNAIQFFCANVRDIAPRCTCDQIKLLKEWAEEPEEVELPEGFM